MQTVKTLREFMITRLFLIVAMTAMVILSLMIFGQQKASIYAKIEDANQTAALIIARNMEIRFQGSAQALERFALLDSIDPDTLGYSWKAEAEHYVSAFPCIEQVYLFDTDLDLVIGYPETDDPVELQEFEEELQTIRLVYPAYDGTNLRGFLVGIIAVHPVIEAAYSEYRELFNMRLLKKDDLILETGDWGPEAATIYHTERIVFNPTHSMEMTITPSARLIEDEMDPADNTLIYLLSLTFAFGVLILIAQKNYALSHLNLRQYRELLERVYLYAVTVGVEGKITFCNDHMCRGTGYTDQELIGADLFDLLLPQISEHEKRGFFLSLQKGNIVRHRELVITTKDGSERTLVLNSTVLRDTRGMVVGFASIGDDITEQLAAHKTLFLQSSALSSAAEGIAILDLEDRVQWGNEALFRLIGYEPSEVIGRTFKDLVRSDEQDESFFSAISECVSSGAVWSGELVNRRADGTLYNEYMTLTPVRDSSGAISHYIAIKRDITQQKQLQDQNRILAEQFEVRQRIESLGKLAGGIAHDFNNLLVPVIGYADLGMLDADPESEVYENFSYIKEAGERAAELTRQILASGGSRNWN